MAAAGNGSADVGVCVLGDFLRLRSQELLQQVRPSRDSQFLGQHAQRILRGDKVDGGDARIGFEGAECLASENGAGCPGNGNGALTILRAAGHKPQQRKGRNLRRWIPPLIISMHGI